MKKITFLFLLLFSGLHVYSQCVDCHNGKHESISHLPPDSSGGLAKSYILQNICGLNWEQSSVEVTTRYSGTLGTGLPATVPLTFSSCSVDSVVKAFLYFNGSYFTAYAANPASVTITNPASTVFSYSADSIGTGGTKCWGETGTIAYRVDVTNSINGGGNYLINVTGTGLDAQSIDGISLVVIYVDKSASYSGSIVLYDGLFTTLGPMHTQTFSGFNVCNATPTGQAFSILADMQSNVNGGINTQTYNGSTSTFPNLFYNFCTVTTPLTAAQTTTTYSVYTNDGGDCYSWVLAGLYWQNTNCMTCVPSVAATGSVTVVPSRDTICQGDSVQLTATGDSSYIWAPATGLSCTNCANPKASPNSNTTYTVTGFIGCAIGVDTITIVVNPRGSLLVSPTSSRICPGATVLLNVTGGNNYVWKPSSSLSCNTCSNPIASPTVTTTYTVTTGSGGCIDSAMVTINVGAPPVFVTNSTPTICAGSSTTLTASGDSAYTWSPSSSLSCSNCATTIATPTITTTYTVVGIYNGGCSDSTTVTVTVIPTLTVSVVPMNPTICSGGSVSLLASGATNYKWAPATNLTCTVCANPTASPTVTTTYTIIGGTSGCKDTATDTVYVVPAPMPLISAKPDTICAGDSVLLIAGGGGNYTWSNGKTTDSIWIKPTITSTITLHDSVGLCADSVSAVIIVGLGGSTTLTLSKDSICPYDTTTLTASGGSGYKWSNGSTASSISVAPGSTKTYTLISNSSCAIDTLIKTVHVIPLPNPIISGRTSLCSGGGDTITISGGYTYKWSNGSTSSSYIFNRITGDSTISVEVYNGKCYLDTTIKILMKQPPVFNPTTGSVCATECITLNANDAGTGDTYKWSNGATTDTTTVCPDTSAFYSLTVSNGCAKTLNTYVNVYYPSLYACCDVTINSGDTASLSALSSTSKYLWSPSTGLSCDTCANVKATPSVTTSYTVTGTDANGCNDSRVITVTVDILCFNFTVPNVFTPNGDGRNDVFLISSILQNSTYNIVIYDRWGKEMYKSSDPAQYWDGNTEGGAKASDGVYFYIISSTCDGKDYDKQGYVQLIR